MRTPKHSLEDYHKILRHIGQQALGLATTLTAEEYNELEQQRQMAREAITNKQK